MRFFTFILFFICSVLNSTAAPVKVGDWTIDLTSEYSEAYIYNETKSLFGIICYEKCIFYINPSNISCDENSKYNMLMNAENEARALEAECVKLQNKYIRIFQDFNVVNNAVKESSFIGFAFALQNGQFNVSRFSLNGAQSAIKQTLENAIKLNNKKNNINKDTRL